MGHANANDQIQKYYQLNHWMKKTKWWWSIFFSGVGVLLSNPHVLYKTFMLSEGVKPQDLFSHY